MEYNPDVTYDNLVKIDEKAPSDIKLLIAKYVIKKKVKIPEKGKIPESKLKTGLKIAAGVAALGTAGYLLHKIYKKYTKKPKIIKKKTVKKNKIKSN